MLLHIGTLPLAANAMIYALPQSPEGIRQLADNSTGCNEMKPCDTHPITYSPNLL